LDHLLYPFYLSFSKEDETLKMKVFATHTEKRVPMLQSDH